MVKAQKDSPVSAEDAIVRRLNVIIRLLLDEQRVSQKTKKNDQLLSLYSLGLTSPEIAQIIGWDSRVVSTQISRLRSSSKRPKPRPKDKLMDQPVNDNSSTR